MALFLANQFIVQFAAEKKDSIRIRLLLPKFLMCGINSPYSSFAEPIVDYDARLTTTFFRRPP